MHVYYQVKELTSSLHIDVTEFDNNNNAVNSKSQYQADREAKFVYGKLVSEIDVKDVYFN